MKQQTKSKETGHETTLKRPRFKIEKLEERIAPAKGGIPGANDGGGRGHHGDKNCRAC